MSSDRLPYRAINPARIRMQPDLKTRIENAAEAMHRSMNSEIVARLEASFEEKPAAARPPAVDYSDEVSAADLAALNAIGERAMAGEGFSLVAGPAWPIGREPSAGLDVDRLDRLTTIVDRTRLALGTNAARELWPMLGLPLLRTSSRRFSPKEEGPDLLSALEDEGSGAQLPASIERKPAKRGRPRKDASERKRPLTEPLAAGGSIEAFLREGCEVSGDHRHVEWSRELFAGYVRFCRANGLYAVHGATFNRRMPHMTRHHFKALDSDRLTHFAKSKLNGGAIYRGIQLKNRWRLPADGGA